MSYFNIEDFRCHDGSFPDWAKKLVALRLIPLCDQIRERFGHPVRVISGYRSPAYNASVGGASDSFHIKALAADLAPVDMSLFGDFCRVVDSLWRQGTIGGKGVYGTFRHVDLGPHRTWGSADHFEEGDDDMGMTPRELKAFQDLQADYANYKTANDKAHEALLKTALDGTQAMVNAALAEIENAPDELDVETVKRIVNEQLEKAKITFGLTVQ